MSKKQLIPEELLLVERQVEDEMVEVLKLTLLTREDLTKVQLTLNGFTITLFTHPTEMIAAIQKVLIGTCDKGEFPFAHLYGHVRWIAQDSLILRLGDQEEKFDEHTILALGRNINMSFLSPS